MKEDFSVGKKGPGYHIRKIEKGVLGEWSKVEEELIELQDAQEQGVRIMAEVELSDAYGSAQRLLEKHFPEFTMDDVAALAADNADEREVKGYLALFFPDHTERNFRDVVQLLQLYKFMEKKLSELPPPSMEDLKRMSVVTRRAFDNGYR